MQTDMSSWIRSVDTLVHTAKRDLYNEGLVSVPLSTSAL